LPSVFSLSKLREKERENTEGKRKNKEEVGVRRTGSTAQKRI
jgi:hypothetical protein